MKNKIYNPSFDYEKKTKALNIEVWGFVSLISMFTICFICCVLHAMFSGVLDIEYTFLYHYSIIIELALVLIFATIFGVGLTSFLNKLLYSYKLEGKKIIKGKIIATTRTSGDPISGVVTAVGLLVNNNPALTMSSGRNLRHIINLIKSNLDSTFVNDNFDSECYAKKEYTNIKLIKETKSKLIYRCDNKRRLVIPKIYEGLGSKSNDRNSSFISRIIKRSLVLFVIGIVVVIIDLSIGIKNNPHYKNNIDTSCLRISDNISKYGYKQNNNCGFEKKVSNLFNSKLKYNIDRQGNLIRSDIELYYDSNNYDEEELRDIIELSASNYSREELNQFVEKVTSCVYNKCEYGNYTIGSLRLRIGISDNYINIHNG